MLTPELVRARQSGGKLIVSKLDGKARPQATAIAERVIALAEEHVGATREELRQACALLGSSPKDKKLVDGMTKLVEDAAEFASVSDLSPVDIRRALFEAAESARQALAPGEAFDRARVLADVAASFGAPAEHVEEALYADLKGAQRLLAFPKLTAGELVRRYEIGQYQAVLLRAERVVASIRCARAADYRLLFNRLKFRRLLFRIEPEADGYRIELSGPFSLFESVTKYGLQLALVLPTLMECERLQLSADVRWGKQRERRVFSMEHRGQGLSGEAEFSDEVRALLEGIERAGGPWQARPASEVLHLPGVGICVPDLELMRSDGARVLVEVLGFWSRDAVWRRVELAERGLSERVLFAVSSRLRVSAEVLDEAVPAALYVYKGAMSARAILEHAEQLARRPAPETTGGAPSHAPSDKRGARGAASR